MLWDAAALCWGIAWKLMPVALVIDGTILAVATYARWRTRRAS